MLEARLRARRPLPELLFGEKVADRTLALQRTTCNQTDFWTSLIIIGHLNSIIETGCGKSRRRVLVDCTEKMLV